MTATSQFGQGNVSESHLLLLLEISNIRSVRVKKALHDYLVNRYTVNDVCLKHFLECSYFYRRLKLIRLLNEKISKISIYYK